MCIFFYIDGSCVDSSISAAYIRKAAIESNSLLLAQLRRQYLYPTIKFSCNGTVTRWIYTAKVVSSLNTVPAELQIWRQLGPDHYIKVGTSLVDFTSTSVGSNIFALVPSSPIVFQEGDIFGMYIPSQANNKIYFYEQKGNGPVNLRVNEFVNSSLSTIATGQLVPRSRNDYPLVTAEISK